MNLRRSLAAKAAVSAATVALVLSTSSAGAFAQESPSPSPSAEATTTSATPTDEAPTEPLPVPKDNTYALGQSLQIRVNADAKQNSDLANFRWSVNQLTVQSPDANGTVVTVPVPDTGSAIRYLNSFGKPTVENGLAQLDAPVENGVGLSRTVSLWPQDKEPNVAMTAKFWLDGQEVGSAQDLVGKSGVVTAQYTVTNQTTDTYDVTVTDLNGNPVTVQAEGQQPIVGIAKTLLPQRYSGLNTGSGMQGADGRANNQVQWIILPFMPIKENGAATFGWSARVTDGVIPSMLVQIAPLYIPAHSEDPAAETPSEGGGSSIPLDPAVAEIQAGLAQVVSGLDALAASKAPPKQCTLPDGTVTTDALACWSVDFNNKITGLAEATVELRAQLPTLIASAGELSTKAAEAATSLDQSQLLTPENIVAMHNIGTALVATHGPQSKTGCQILADGTADGDNPIDLASCEKLAPVLAGLPDNPGDAGKALANGVNTLNDVSDLLLTVQGGLTKLNDALNRIVTLEANASVEEIVAGIKADLIARGGDQVLAGFDQVSAGVTQAKSIVAAYVSGLVAEIQAAGANANQVLIEAKANIAALKAAAATSPLPYGGDVANVPPGTVLAGAYEFRVDAADNNTPYTGPRILVGLLALIGAALIARFVRQRNERRVVTPEGDVVVDDDYGATRAV